MSRSIHSFKSFLQSSNLKVTRPAKKEMIEHMGARSQTQRAQLKPGILKGIIKKNRINNFMSNFCGWHGGVSVNGILSDK